MKRALLGLGFVALSGCVDPGGPQMLGTSLNIVPDFGANAAFANHVDQLVVTLEREGDAGGFSFVLADTVAIDPATGEATIEISVVLRRSPESFRITLQAIRSSSGAVVFEGVTTQALSTTGGTAVNTVTVTVAYTGVQPASVVVTPKDTSLLAGSSYQLAATAMNAQGAPLPDVPITFEFVTASDANVVSLERLTGNVAIPAGTPNQEIFMYARTPNERRDTTRLFVGQAAAGIEIVPGFGNLLIGGGLQLAGTVVDANGNPIAFSPTYTWTSRSPSVAGVSGSGLVTGNATGSAVIVATAVGFTDSITVNVVPANTVPVSTLGAGRAFGETTVGATITVDIIADLSFVGEALGSYNATFTWNPAQFQYVTISGADMPNPVVNTNNTGTGELRFTNIDPNGQLTGQVTIAQIQLRALTAGTFRPSLSITEMSAAVTFTDLISNVAVIEGDITVR